MAQNCATAFVKLSDQLPFGDLRAPGWRAPAGPRRGRIVHGVDPRADEGRDRLAGVAPGLDGASGSVQNQDASWCQLPPGAAGSGMFIAIIPVTCRRLVVRAMRVAYPRSAASLGSPPASLMVVMLVCCQAVRVPRGSGARNGECTSSLLRKACSAEFLLRPRGERGSADGTQRSQDDSDRHCGRGAGAAGVHGACLPVMRASTREEMRRISSTSRSSSRLFSIHSR